MAGTKRKLPSIPFFIHLRLSEVEDDDLIKFFQSIPKRRRATAIKSALRAGGMQSVGADVENAEDDEALAASVEDFLK